MSRKGAGSLVAVLLFTAAGIVAALNIQYLQDTVLYHQYEPNAMVASFAADSGMSDHGKFLFYASHPSLSDAQSFNQQCGMVEKTAAVLGCYDGRNIYIYDITDARLAGVRPTTAAHEMLHAAYKRLSNTDRERVNTLLAAEYAKLKDNEELAGRMAFYERTQPGERDNELHSIIGTEIGSISGDLETYYKRYFADRSKVVAQHENYASLFKELRDRADELDTQINQLEGRIVEQRAAYDAELKAVQAAIASFNGRAQRGEFTSQAAFDQERRGIVAKTNQLDSLRAEINDAITRYNALIEELNAIATETNTLNRSMDSKIEPAPSL